MFKKISALLLALICAISMTMPAFATEHDHSTVVGGADPTCTEPGYIEYLDGCKDVIEAKGHNYSSTSTKYNCVEQDEVITYTCACGDTYDETVKTKTGVHTWTAVNAVEATCQAAGNNGGKKCSVCGVDKPDEVATVIPQRTHDFVEETSSLYLFGSTDTCVNNGKAIYKCKYCDYLVETDEPIESYCAVKNTDSKYVVERDYKAATCYEDGKEADKYCKFCNVRAKTGATISMTTVAHTYRVENKKAPTCTEPGYTGDKICTVCEAAGKEVTDSKVPGDEVPANGHDLEPIYIINPTCNAPGYGYLDCKDCEYRFPALGEEGISFPAHSTTLEDIPAVAPTCTEPGSKDGKKCSGCGYIYTPPTVVPALGHGEEEALEAKEPTCTEPGWEADGKKCKVCGEITLDPTPILALNHKDDIDIEPVAPTCTKPGSKDGKKCSRCGEISVEPTVVNALGHTEETIPAIEATCTATGIEGNGIKCSVCEEILTESTVTEINPNNHTALREIPAVAPTCTLPGADKGEVCDACGLVTDPTELVAATGHKNIFKNLVNCDEDVEGYTEYECETCGELSIYYCKHEQILDDISATCTTDGSKEYACGYVVTIPALGHGGIDADGDGIKDGLTIIQPVEPTCTEPGNTADVYCNVCNTRLLTSTTLEATGHDYFTVEAKAPTCTETGLHADRRECRVCGDKPDGEVIIPANGHNVVDIPAVAPTCISVGYTAGKGCTECDYIEVEPQVIPANGHSWVLESTLSVAPSCSRDGKEVYYCKACGEKHEKVVYATGNHNFVIVETQAATCTEQGYSKNRCTVCGEEFIAPALPIGHTESIDKGFAATCTTDGLTDGSHCGRCGDVLKEQVVIPATGHKEEAVKGSAATCTTAGLTDGKKCSTCGTVTVAQTVIPATGHKLETVKGYAPTCTSTGLTDGSVCSVCGDVIVAQTVIPATAHKEEAVKGSAATCTTAGLTDGKQCSVCNTVTVKQNIIPVVAHNIKVLNKKSATYTKSGYTGDEYCTSCNKVINKGSSIAKKTLKAPKLKITTKKGKINVTLSNVDKAASGFKITYKKAGGKWVTKTYKSIKDLKKTLTKLSSGKKYYVKVRMFVHAGNATAYSKYSSTKTIKVK